MIRPLKKRWSSLMRTVIANLSSTKKIVIICCVVKFFPWFKFYFPLFKTLSINHTLSYPKTTENKI